MKVDLVGKSMDSIALLSLNEIVLGLHPIHELAEDTTLTSQPTIFSGLTISYSVKSEKEVAYNPFWKLDENDNVIL